MKERAGRNASRQSPDCMASSSMTIETADGLEQVNWNMGTGEITYGPSACEMQGREGSQAEQTMSDESEQLV